MKYKKGKKLWKITSPISWLFVFSLSLFFGLFFGVRETNAVSLTPSFYRINISPSGGGNYTWSSNYSIGSKYQAGSSSWTRLINYQLNSTTTSGNYVSVHSEPNIVYCQGYAGTGSRVFYPEHMDLITLRWVYASGGEKQWSNVQTNPPYAVTNWYDSSNSYCTTVTLYLDFTISDFPNDSTGYFNLNIGNLNNYFLSTTSQAYIYLEQAPTTVLYSTNLDNALLQTQIQQNNTQIQQNETIINQNQTLINEQNQTQQEIQNQTQQENQNHQEQMDYNEQNSLDAEQDRVQETSDASQAESDASQEDLDGSTDSLLSVIGNFVTAITSASPSTCVLSLPMMPEMGNNLNVDFCGLDPPAPITALLSVVVVFTLVPLAKHTLNRITNLIGSFQR